MILTSGRWRVGSPQHNAILVMPHIGSDEQLTDADVRLIAAAPELLEACKDAIFALETIGTAEALTSGAWSTLIDVVAKAEGRE